MRTRLALALVIAVGGPCMFAANGWVPDKLLPPAPATGPVLCRRDYLKPAEGKAVLDAALARFPDRASWEGYAAHLRERIQTGAGLAPWPRRTPLNVVSRNRREGDGYSVENIAFESVPGNCVTGNLYRPLGRRGPFPAVLATHGHRPPITSPADYNAHARFGSDVQVRCATLARMGAVVFVIDMFGYGESMGIVGAAEHQQASVMTIQLWNAMRAVDFLSGLSDVDPKRIAVSGESGGGTQAFLLTALDPRIAASVPVVMVSSYFFGGCACESGQPIHRSEDHFASNVMIAALAAPRPMLVVSDGSDWTQHVPEIEYPFLRRIYDYYGAANAVENVHLAHEGHDYGPSKRAAAAAFLATRLGLDLASVSDAAGHLDESHVTVLPAAQLRVFDADFPIPPTALHTGAAVASVIRSLQKE